MGRRLPAKYKRVALLVVDGEIGEAAMADLTNELGSPVVPAGPKSAVFLLRQSRADHGVLVEEFAFTTGERAVPQVPVELGPGLILLPDVLKNMWHFSRVATDERSAQLLKHRRGHGRPPLMSGVWIDEVWARHTRDLVARLLVDGL